MRSHHHPPTLHHHLATVLKSCCNPQHMKQSHALILTLDRGESLSAALALSYLSISLLDPALVVFHTIPTPPPFLSNTLLRALASASRFPAALRLYSRLPSPDNFSLPFALNSSAALSRLQTGRQIHLHSIRSGSSSHPFVAAALVHMYSKCGDVATARLVFDRMPTRDLVSWTSMISGYAHNSYSLDVLHFFVLMRRSNVEHNRVGLLSALLACGLLGALRKGACFHGYAVCTGLDSDLSVGTALVDMYSKSGSLDLARLVFDRVSGKDVVCWSAMIASYGCYGLGRDAIRVFDTMVEAGVRPNHVTFTSLLSACSHSRLLEQGKKHFDSMSSIYGLNPELNHYACMVDLLARSGELYEAQQLIARMPMQPNASLWGSLLGACRIHGDLDLGEKIADKIFELGVIDSGYYVLLSNIYAAKSRWNDASRVRRLMTGRRVSKVQGFSLIEFGNEIHEFGVDDRSHPQSKEIYAYLEEMSAAMKQLGYVRLLGFVLHDIEDEMKEAALSYHSIQPHQLDPN